MYELQYTIASLIGLVSFIFAVGLYRWHHEVELFAAVSFIAWTVIALQGSTITVLDETGTAHTVGSGGAQLLTAGLALVSLIALIGSLMGRWPSTENNT